jgi:hypothetical protein
MRFIPLELCFYSPWYPPGVKPVRAGNYLTRHPRAGSFHTVLLRWNGKHWYDLSGGTHESNRIPATEQIYSWRGLGFDPRDCEIEIPAP